ncbi:MAG: ATP-binding protein [Gammaproteobacteria bacterium]|nr:ATP-binding protein [Gammaproteobacteria bacterium]
MAKITAARHLRVRYIIGLGLLALVVTGSFLAKQHAISVQHNLSELVKLSGQQSGLANRIGYLSLVMITTNDDENYAHAKTQLQQNIDEMEAVHWMLLHGSSAKGIPLVSNEKLQSLYYNDSVGLNISIRSFLENARAIQSSPRDTPGIDSYEYSYLTNYGPKLLESLFAAAVDEYAKLGHDSIVQIQRLEQSIWLGTLFVLLLEALLIFKPLERRIRETIGKLQSTVNELESTREQFAAAREKAESASEAKSQFLATMTHELRTPMNGVLGMSELLSATKMSDKQQEYVQIILDSSESLLTIINDILDFSRLEAGKVGLEKIPFDLEQSAYDVMALLAPRCQNKPMQLILDYAPNLPRHFIGDPARIRQIFFNLIGNASKFTEQGYIQVSVSVEVDDGNTGNISIHVEDTGIGIAQEKAGRLFHSFTQADSSTTRKYGGTGLGLTITRELVTLMGGHIELDSAPGKGSVFTVFFPLELADEGDQIPLPDEALKHVMLFEPNSIYCELIIDRLARINVEASVVDNAREIKSRLLVCEEHDVAKQLVIVSQEALLDKNNDWSEFSDGSLRNPISWIVLGNGIEDSEKLKTSTQHLQGYTTFMQKPFTNYQFYYALNTSISQPEAGTETRAQVPDDEDATDFTLSMVSKGNILLVEDNIANQKFASFLLTKMGYNADIAEDGQEAIRLWREKNYQLILMDCLMPTMDGYQSTLKIRREEQPNARIPIIALTANASETDRQKCRQSGMDEVLTKPYRRHELEEVLDRWLHEEPSFITITHNQARDVG